MCPICADSGHYADSLGLHPCRCRAQPITSITRAALAAQREACAAEVEAIKMDEILLALGEMTAQERRTCKALLALVAHRLRSGKR